MIVTNTAAVRAVVPLPRSATSARSRHVSQVEAILEAFDEEVLPYGIEYSAVFITPHR